MDKVNKWTTENVLALKKRLKALRLKVAEARDAAARKDLEEVRPGGAFTMHCSKHPRQHCHCNPRFLY
jgi:hypothetical protein